MCCRSGTRTFFTISSMSAACSQTKVGNQGFKVRRRSLDGRSCRRVLRYRRPPRSRGCRTGYRLERRNCRWDGRTSSCLAQSSILSALFQEMRRDNKDFSLHARVAFEKCLCLQSFARHLIRGIRRGWRCRRGLGKPGRSSTRVTAAFQIGLWR